MEDQPIGMHVTLHPDGEVTTTEYIVEEEQ